MKLKHIFLGSVLIATTIFAMETEIGDKFEKKICYDDGTCFYLNNLYNGQFSEINDAKGGIALVERGSLVTCSENNCDNFLQAYRDMVYKKK